jgi:hypothetical protein
MPTDSRQEANNGAAGNTSRESFVLLLVLWFGVPELDRSFAVSFSIDLNLTYIRDNAREITQS